MDQRVEGCTGFELFVIYVHDRNVQLGSELPPRLYSGACQDNTLVTFGENLGNVSYDVCRQLINTSNHLYMLATLSAASV